MMPTFLQLSYRGLGLVEQPLLPDDIGLAALASLRAGIIGIYVAAPVRTEIGLCTDEGTRIGDDVENPLIQRLGRDRLGQELGDAAVARRDDTLLLGMSGQHDDRYVGIGIGSR